MEDNITNIDLVAKSNHFRYEFDFDKIKTVEDAIRILKALRIQFGEQYPAFEEVKDLLKEVEVNKL